MSKGKFGKFGGQYVSEMLMPALIELEDAYKKYYPTEEFQAEFKSLLHNYAGRPTPLYHAERFSEKVGCKVYLKREESGMRWKP